MQYNIDNLYLKNKKGVIDMKKEVKIGLIVFAIAIVIIAAIVIVSQSKNNSNNENGLFGSSQKSSAKLIEDNSAEYYGATVTNYQANGVTDWKIFHSDGTNIYLISSNYVPISSVPKTKGGGIIKNYLNSQNLYAAPLNAATSDTTYIGSDSILSSNPARKWISYLDTQSSTQNNMKAVAYLMDIEQWNIFKDDVFSEYAIGGPTLDLFVASYNKTHNTKTIETQLESNKGYKVKWSTDENYSNILKGISTSESLYVISDSEVYGMYLAAPSATGGYGIMGMDKNGNLESTNCTMSINGFRPIVCLKSNTQVINNNDGSVTLK